MTEYVIKHYQEGYEIEQEKVGKEVAMSFVFPHQTPAEQLKQHYTAEGFDPETRLYAFKGDKMVGFLTSKVLPKDEDDIVKANLTPPIVLEGHEKAIDLLFNKGFEVLKSKGVKKVTTRIGAYYNISEEIAKKFGFKFIDEQSVVYNIKVSDIDDSISTDHIRDYNEDKDEKRSVKLLAESSGQSIEWAQGLYTWLKGPGKIALLGSFIIEEENEFVAQALLLRNRLDMKLAQLTYIITKDEKHMEPILAKIAKVCKENKYEQIVRLLNKDLFALKDSITKIGFTQIGKVGIFEKEL